MGLRQVEVERVEQVDGGARGVHGDLRRHLEQLLGVVEDDLHPAVDELEGIVSDEDVVVGVLAVPADNAQEVADRLVEAGVKIIFNYSEQLLQVPPEVTVHTSSPAVDLLYALYFYLA